MFLIYSKSEEWLLIFWLNQRLLSFWLVSVVDQDNQDNFKAIKTISSQSIFFYEKILSTQKAPKHKTNNFHLLRSFCARKIVTFVFCLLIFVLLVGFGLICIFVHLKSFCKKNKQAWNCLDSLIYSTTSICCCILTKNIFVKILQNSDKI